MLPPTGTAMAVVGFTAHRAIAVDLPEEWVRERLTTASTWCWRRAAWTASRRSPRRGRPPTHANARAFARRDGVRVFEGEGAVVAFGRGLAGRSEVSIEVDPAARGRGVARRALVEARRLVGPDGVVFAQVAPGNAASLRAFLRAGFEPIGSEALFL